jgi:hypothetical protein
MKKKRLLMFSPSKMKCVICHLSFVIVIVICHLPFVSLCSFEPVAQSVASLTADQKVWVSIPTRAKAK